MLVGLSVPQLALVIASGEFGVVTAQGIDRLRHDLPEMVEH